MGHRYVHVKYCMRLNIIHVSKACLSNSCPCLSIPILYIGLHYVSKAMSDPTKRAGAIMSFMSRDKQFWTPFSSEAYVKEALIVSLSCLSPSCSSFSLVHLSFLYHLFSISL